MSRMKVRDYRADKITFKDIEVGQIFKSESHLGVFIKAFDFKNLNELAVKMTDGSIEHFIGEDDEVIPVEAELVIKWMGVKEE